MSLEGNFLTDIGEARYTLTQGNHVHIGTPESRNDDGLRAMHFVIRGIPYHASFHLNFMDGQWKVTNPNEGYVSRGDFSDKTPSDSVKKTIREAFIKAWTAFVTPTMIREAEIKRQRSKVAGILGKIEDLEKQRKGLADQLAESFKVLSRLVYRVEYNLGGAWRLWNKESTRDTEEEARELFEEVRQQQVQSLVGIRILTHNEDGTEIVLEQTTTP